MFLLPVVRELLALAVASEAFQTQGGHLEAAALGLRSNLEQVIHSSHPRKPHNFETCVDDSCCGIVKKQFAKQ